MKTYLKILSVSLVLLSVMFTSGCIIRRHRSPYEHQPLVGPGKRAKAEMIYRSFTKGQWIDFEWNLGIFNTIDADEVISTCEKYLEDNGVKSEYVTTSRNELGRAFPWEYWTIKSYLDEDDLKEDEVYLKEEYANKRGEYFAKLHVIVCLKPVVIVSLDQPIPYWRYLTASNGNLKYFNRDILPTTDKYAIVSGFKNTSAVLHRDSEESFTKKISYVITNPEGNEIDTSHYDHSAFYWRTCRGYGYGTRIPYKKDIKWFSPELDVLPTEPEFVSDDVRRIKVPWGWLVLEHKGDEWIVKGVRK